MPLQANTLFAPLLTDTAVHDLFATPALLDGMLAFERALTEALIECGSVERAVGQQALSAMDSFDPDIAQIQAAVLIDGLPVPEWVRQLKAHAGDAATAIHVGATSQDVLDTAWALALRSVNDVLDQRLATVIDRLNSLSDAHGHKPLIGRTRMQAALPITVGDRLAIWRLPLMQHRERLSALRPRIEVAHFGGPVGLRDRPASKGDDVARFIASSLGLQHQPRASHAMRQDIVEYGLFLTVLCGSLGKMGQDIALMAQQGIDEIGLKGGGSSSAMPHKQNPVLAETLVALARHATALGSGLSMAMVHEHERSGSAWTLEWLTLPGIAETAATALAHAERLLDQIVWVGKP